MNSITSNRVKIGFIIQDKEAYKVFTAETVPDEYASSLMNLVWQGNLTYRRLETAEKVLELAKCSKKFYKPINPSPTGIYWMDDLLNNN